MAHAVFNKPFQLYTDAAKAAIGSVFAQVQDQWERVTAYASKCTENGPPTIESYGPLFGQLDTLSTSLLAVSSPL